MFQTITLTDFINVCVGFGSSLNWGNDCSSNILLGSFSVLPEVRWCRASSEPKSLPSVIHSPFEVSSLLQFTRNKLQTKNIPIAFIVGTKYEISSSLVCQHGRRMRIGLRSKNATYALLAIFLPQRSASSNMLGNSFPEGQLRVLSPSISVYETSTRYSELRLNTLFLVFPVWRKGLGTHVLWRRLLFTLQCIKKFGVSKIYIYVASTTICNPNGDVRNSFNSQREVWQHYGFSL